MRDADAASRRRESARWRRWTRRELARDDFVLVVELERSWSTKVRAIVAWIRGVLRRIGPIWSNTSDVVLVAADTNDGLTIAFRSRREVAAWACARGAIGIYYRFRDRGHPDFISIMICTGARVEALSLFYWPDPRGQGQPARERLDAAAALLLSDGARALLVA